MTGGLGRGRRAQWDREREDFRRRAERMSGGLASSKMKRENESASFKVAEWCVAQRVSLPKHFVPAATGQSL